jgi:Ca2+-binding RTX toxin-like protein
MPTYNGTDGNDDYTGTVDADIINGGLGNDILHGGDGNDTIDGGPGTDQSYGDAGNDLLIISSAPVVGEIYDGGADTDTLRFMTTAGNLVTTSNGPQYQGQLTGQYLSLERLEFGSLNGFGLSVLVGWPLLGTTGLSEIVGGAGADQLTLFAQGDVNNTYTIPTFAYSNWTNIAQAFGTGDVVVLFGGGAINYTLNAATGHLGVQALVSSNGNDTLNGTDGMELLNGGGGVNTLNGFGGDDVLVAVNNVPFGGVPTNNTYLGSVFNGGTGFDWLSVGGYVNFQGTLNSIEGINFQPAFTSTALGTASQGYAELDIDTDRFDVISSTLTLRGNGDLNVFLQDGQTLDASGWVHLEGSDVFIQFFSGGDNETVIGTAGNNRFSGGFGQNTFTGNAGIDVFEAGEGQVTVTDFTIGTDLVDLQDMNITSWAQLQPYLSQQGANVVFSRLYGGVAQTMTLLNVSLASLSAADFVFQTGDDNDTRIGTDFDDDLIGGNGNDTLEGLGGNDYLFGGGGNDTANGGGGADEVYGGSGDDFVNGQGGNDLVDGGDGNDTVRGAGGDDQLLGGAGNDNLRGGTGVDSYIGGDNDLVLNSLTGYGDRISFYEPGATAGVVADLRTGVISNDGFGNIETMTGIESLGSDTAFVDTFYGNDGINALYGNRGDNLYGFGGDDRFLITSTAAIVDGGAGIDTLVVASWGGWLMPDTNSDGQAEEAPAASAGWTINLATGAVTDGYGNNGAITGIENLDGSELNDSFTGDGNANVLTGGAGNDFLGGGGGNDTLSGGDGNDQLRGNAGDDQLTGGIGNDLLGGGSGIDSFDGGTGSESFGGNGYGDRISFYDAAATAAVVADLRTGIITNDGYGNAETMIGIESLGGDTAFADTFYGNDGSNFFQANRGDILYAFGGTDAMTLTSAAAVADGGDGTDLLWLDNFGQWLMPDGNGDGLAELAAAATSGWSVNLSTGMLVDGYGNIGSLTGFEYISATAQNDTLIGGSGNDNLAGHFGNDTISGGDGNDFLAGDDVFDFVDNQIVARDTSQTAPGGNDQLDGGAGNDTLLGGEGDDYLDGGTGDDTMRGGKGNDVIVVDSVGDVVIENLNEGTDEVRSWISYTLGANVENLTLVGVAANSGTGNSLNNTITGNAAANILNGGGGNDTLVGGGGNDIYIVQADVSVSDGGYVTTGIDQVIEASGEGIDTVISNAGFDLGANVENLTLVGSLNVTGWGNSLNNVIIGNSGNNFLQGFDGDDYLDGGAGNDFMVGGNGNDTYVVDSIDDEITPESPSAEGGIDAVISSIDYTLAFALENLTLVGSAIAGNGNSLANYIAGNAMNNTLFGGGGNDTILGGDGNDGINGDFGLDIITGGAGSDTLTGGADADTFVDTAAGLNGDTITDLSAADRIVITDAILGNFNYSLSGNTLTYSGGSLTFSVPLNGHFVASVAAGGGVQLTLVPTDVANDFNGDGRSDILWRHSDGTIMDFLGRLDGGFVNNYAISSSYLNNSWQLLGTGDFNGDNRDDLMLRFDNGLFMNWLGNPSGSFLNNYNNAGYLDNSWHLLSIGDVNGDNRDDLIFRNDNGLIFDMLGQINGSFTNNYGNAAYLNNSWEVSATGDFNGDGRTDILWENDTGLVMDWLGQTDGSFLNNYGQAAFLDNSWTVIGTGDFNGDHRDDILWRNTNGLVMDWLGQVDGSFTINYGNAAFLNSSWHLAGTDDYNGDGLSDILWRNDNGLIMNWLGQVNGTFLNNYGNAAFLDPSWSLVDAGDYNGDGRDDLLFRHANGLVFDWLGQDNGSFANNYANAAYLSSSWVVQTDQLL